MYSGHEAVDWACKENLLDGFIREQKNEVIAMCLTEYDEEACIRTWREDGIDIGRAEGAREAQLDAAKNLYANGVSIEIIAKSLGMTQEEVKDIVG